jgi:phosphohistidine swiveling domain-containing protein
MIFEERTYKLDSEHWRRINMRKVAHLAGAEMIHNLYDRHWPQINSIRFRHTITNFHGGIVESYAPIEEWKHLQRWVSEKFITLNPILLHEIERILSPTYELTGQICALIDGADLKKVGDSQLAMLLIDIMDFPLGEIYKLNVVQIEYGLNFALHRILEEYEPDASERNRLLAQLISPQELTVAQMEEVAFGEIVAWARQHKAAVADPRVEALLRRHYGEYAGKHCAYGETPPLLNDYLQKFAVQVESAELVSRAAAEREVAKQYAASQELLRRLNDERLSVLCNLMSRIGVFRDQNKARLGETILRRLRIMDEISRRTGVKRGDLDLYLVSDMVGLLDGGKPLAPPVLARRRKGVSFVRNDHLAAGAMQTMRIRVKKEGGKRLPGTCASPGKVAGAARIISTKEDIAKMKPGDIMVAIGTDFDLLEIMHLAAGIITEEGGLLSHASVVSRELGKPCLIGVAGATHELADGDSIVLDAAAGYIEVK